MMECPPQAGSTPWWFAGSGPARWGGRHCGAPAAAIPVPRVLSARSARSGQPPSRRASRRSTRRWSFTPNITPAAKAGPHHGPGRSQVHRDGLLAQHVFAGGGRVQRVLAVQAVHGADVDGIDVLPPPPAPGRSATAAGMEWVAANAAARSRGAAGDRTGGLSRRAHGRNHSGCGNIAAADQPPPHAVRRSPGRQNSCFRMTRLTTSDTTPIPRMNQP